MAYCAPRSGLFTGRTGTQPQLLDLPLQATSLRELLDWLSVSARAGGQFSVPFCTGASSGPSASMTATLAPCWQPAAVERRYRAALGRVRAATFAPSSDAAEELSLTRRSGRVRQLPDVFVPFEEPGFGRCGARPGLLHLGCL